MSLFKYSAPSSFYPIAGKLVPWFSTLAFIAAVIGLYLGLFVAPEDFQQGEVYRIIFIHVPAAWLSMVSMPVPCLEITRSAGLASITRALTPP